MPFHLACLLPLWCAVSAGIALAELQITELMGPGPEAANRHGWIEIRNNGPFAVDLEGYSLSDGAKGTAAWPFPAGSRCAPGAYLVVQASGQPALGPMHASFTLSQQDASVALFDREGKVVASLGPSPDALGSHAFGVPHGRPSSPSLLARATPGKPNVAERLADPCGAPRLTPPHGFYDAPIALVMHAAEPGAVIRYTLDGSLPSPHRGQVYEGPITIAETSIVRALAYTEQRRPGPVRTQSYLFADDILKQKARPPAGWPHARFVNSQRLIFGLESAKAIGAEPQELRSALTALPSLSIVTDLAHLFDPQRGIYVNADRRGRLWERPVSIECIDPSGQEAGFEVNAGLRIRGGASRRGSVPKHSFRAYFRSEHGNGKLRYPLFGRHGTDLFDDVDLRTPQNYSWASTGSPENTFLRDGFCRDTQGALGEPYTRSRYFHLYLNGLYWGLYEAQEHSEASYATQYFGGTRDDYDVVKVERLDMRSTRVEATDGDLEAWRHLWETANLIAALPDEEERDGRYRALQGLRADGSRDAALPVYLDMENLIAYMAIIFFTENADGPISRFLENAQINNWFALRPRDGRMGFQFFVHDSEHSLGLPADEENNRLGPFSCGENFQQSNPQWIHQQLLAVDAYRRAFTDFIHEHTRPGGALSYERCLQRLDRRAALLDPVIPAHAARWGAARRHPARNKQDWLHAVESTRHFLRDRGEALKSELAMAARFRDGHPRGTTIAAPLWPRIEAPEILAPGAENLFFSQWDKGSVHYTVDGGDPAQPGDSEVHKAPRSRWQTRALIDASTPLRMTTAAVAHQDQLPWHAPQAAIGDWQPGAWGLLAPAKSDASPYQHETDPADAQWIESVFVRCHFQVKNPAQLSSLRLHLACEDGAEVFVNGHALPLPRETFRPVMEAWETEHEARAEIPLSLVTPGSNLLAVHGIRRRSSPFPHRLTARLTAIEFSEKTPIQLESPSGEIRARAKFGSQWSALTRVAFGTNDERADAMNLIVSEIMYHPAVPDGREARSGFADADDFEFVELLNIGSRRIRLNGVRFIDGIKFQFDSSHGRLDPGERIVLAKDPRAFRIRYGQECRLAGPYAGNLKNGGERLTLLDGSGQRIQRFEYEDGDRWPNGADGLGFSLVVIDAAQRPDLSKAASWRASAELGGSPGLPEPDEGVPEILVNEILTNSDPPTCDAIELFNPTAKEVAVGGWFLTDDAKDPKKWAIPSDVRLPPKGYWVAFEHDPEAPAQTGAASPRHFGSAFSLSSHGEEIFLFSADAAGELTGYSHGFSFDASAVGQSIGLVVDSAGIAKVALQRPSLGLPNEIPEAGEVVLSEIHYHPEDTDVDELSEFVEITNRTDRAIPLYDPERPAHTWKLDGYKFRFPEGIVLQPREVILIARIAPDDFRARFQVPDGTRIFGPPEGMLANSGERLRLERPGPPEWSEDGTERIPMIAVDSVRYNDKHPWPEEADGSGKTLERVTLTGFGDDPATWRASQRPRGSPGL